jgi:ABC-type lipoprotein release transport system permease subunit
MAFRDELGPFIIHCSTFSEGMESGPVGVTLVLTTVAVTASYIPALRAMRLDPITPPHSE